MCPLHTARMARWAAVLAAEPEFAYGVRELFDAHKHKTMATLRRDGSPRISGIEVEFNDGDVWLGMMPGSVKAADLRRDQRLALHSASVDPVEGEEGSWAGDAKLAGRAVEIAHPDGVSEAGHRFRVEIAEVVRIRVGDPADHLVIESWRERAGLRRRIRR